MIVVRTRRGRRVPNVLAGLLLALLGGALLLVSCSSLPTFEGRTVTSAQTAERAHATVLGQAVQSLVAVHPDVSDVHPLGDPLAAFAARMVLARQAERGIGAQDYVWQNDITGNLLLRELERAARRGVRMRLLIDDNGIR